MTTKGTKNVLASLYEFKDFDFKEDYFDEFEKIPVVKGRARPKTQQHVRIAAAPNVANLVGEEIVAFENGSSMPHQSTVSESLQLMPSVASLVDPFEPAFDTQQEDSYFAQALEAFEKTSSCLIFGYDQRPVPEKTYSKPSQELSSRYYQAEGRRTDTGLVPLIGEDLQAQIYSEMSQEKVDFIHPELELDSLIVLKESIPAPFPSSESVARYFMNPIMEKLEQTQERQLLIPGVFDDVATQVYLDLASNSASNPLIELTIEPPTFFAQVKPVHVIRPAPPRSPPSSSSVEFSSLLAPIHTYYRSDTSDSSSSLLPSLEKDNQAQVYMEMSRKEREHTELDHSFKNIEPIYTTDYLQNKEILHFKKFLKSLVNEVQAAPAHESVTKLAERVGRLHNPLTGKEVGKSFFVKLLESTKKLDSIRPKVAANEQSTKLTSQEKELVKSIASIVAGDVKETNTQDLASDVVNSLGIKRTNAKL
jgi:hypothetical protein